MTQTTVDTTTELLPGTEMLPDVKYEMITYTEAKPQEKTEIDNLMQEINLADSNSIIFFGSKAQQELTSISDSMLEGVRNKDLGSAGNSLNNMVTVLRGFEVEDFDPNERPGLLRRLWRRRASAS